MTDPEYDAELEAFLKRRSPIHQRLSDIDHAEPSVELDRLILSRAREALDTPAEPLFRTSRWALPVGLAAAILIAFAVVLNIDHQHAKVASNASPAAEAAAPAVARAASVRESATVDQPRVLSDSAAREPRDAQLEKRAEVPSAALAKRAGSAGSSRNAEAAAAIAANPHSSPDAWLREINRLRAAGRTADADRELAAFRAAYPTHPAYSVAKPPAR